MASVTKSTSSVEEQPVLAADLRLAIENRLKLCGFSVNGHVTPPKQVGKEGIRNLHAPNRAERLEANREFLAQRAPGLIADFADGSEVDPRKIDPELVEVESETPAAHLFRFATMLWSVPVSSGFGRRMRFLVRDRQNNKLIGLFALGDPVFNLSARDKWIGWSSQDREKRLIRVMDAYVVGAVPPYSQLIGGKLVASLMGSDDVKKVYERRYLKLQSVISGEKKRARLTLITTTSALGRSSIYNRLKIPEGPSLTSIGVTKGFGHFHLSGDLFELMRRFLAQQKHPYASGHKFGMGPNWRIRVARAAIENIGMSGDSILRHGVEREVFAMPLATNWKELLLGQHERQQSTTRPVSEISKYCKERWMEPRALRDPSFRSFMAASLLARISMSVGLDEAKV